MRNNSWFLFSPFLLLYLIISIAFAQNALVGDEGRYLAFAHNLLNGFYSPPAPEINLWNGPGYPLLISIILMLKLPLIAIRLINGIKCKYFWLSRRFDNAPITSEAESESLEGKRTTHEFPAKKANTNENAKLIGTFDGLI